MKRAWSDRVRDHRKTLSYAGVLVVLVVSIVVAAMTFGAGAALVVGALVLGGALTGAAVSKAFDGGIVQLAGLLILALIAAAALIVGWVLTGGQSMVLSAL